MLASSSHLIGIKTVAETGLAEKTESIAFHFGILIIIKKYFAASLASITNCCYF
jgi:hypothetical protein